MNGNKVVTYSYDFWGKVESIKEFLADTIGKINPMRYRGYYQDEETGLFYVGSRYYDPNTCRFLNADNPSYINISSPVGASLFAYCANNPVMYSDPSGQLLKELARQGIKVIFD